MTVELSNDGTNWTDITGIIKYGGLTFSRNDVEAPDSGRTLDGLMHRGRVAVKEKMTVNTIPLTKSQLSDLETLIYPETFYCRVTPYPQTNAAKTLTVYTNNVKSTYIIHRTSDDLESVTFPLIEV